LFSTDLITADAPINSSSPTVLVVAGGGANDSLQNMQFNGTDGSLSLISPYSDVSGRQGGQSYVISKATHVQDSPGNGEYGAPGDNEYVDISFYS